MSILSKKKEDYYFNNIYEIIIFFKEPLFQYIFYKIRQKLINLCNEKINKYYEFNIKYTRDYRDIIFEILNINTRTKITHCTIHLNIDPFRKKSLNVFHIQNNEESKKLYMNPKKNHDRLPFRELSTITKGSAAYGILPDINKNKISFEYKPVSQNYVDNNFITYNNKIMNEIMLMILNILYDYIFGDKKDEFRSLSRKYYKKYNNEPGKIEFFINDINSKIENLKTKTNSETNTNSETLTKTNLETNTNSETNTNLETLNNRSTKPNSSNTETNSETLSSRSKNSSNNENNKNF